MNSPLRRRFVLLSLNRYLFLRASHLVLLIVPLSFESSDTFSRIGPKASFIKVNRSDSPAKVSVDAESPFGEV